MSDENKNIENNQEENQKKQKAIKAGGKSCLVKTQPTSSNKLDTKKIEIMFEQEKNPRLILKEIEKYKYNEECDKNIIAKICNYKGLCYRLLNDYKKAILFFEKAISLNEDFYSPIYNIATTYHYYLNERDKAEDYYLKFIFHNPNDSNAEIYLSDLYYENGKYNLAVKYFEKSLQNKDIQNYYQYFTKYGIALYKNNKKEKAIKIFKNILQYVDNIDIIENLYIISLEMQDYKNANEYLNLLLEKEPNNYLYNIRKANVYSIISNSELLKHLENAISIDKNRYEAYLGLARYYVEQCNNSLAEKNYEMVLNIENYNEEILIEIGNFLLLIHNYKKAYEIFIKIIHINNMNYKAYLSLLEISLHNKNFIEQTKDIINSQIKNNNYLEYMYSLLASLFLAENNIYEAKIYIDLAIKINNKYLKAYEILLELYKYQNNYKKIIEIQDIIKKIKENC